MMSKASMSQIDSIQKEMDEFINKEQFQGMMTRLEGYTSLESFNKYRLLLEKDMDGFR